MLAALGPGPRMEAGFGLAGLRGEPFNCRLRTPAKDTGGLRPQLPANALAAGLRASGEDSNILEAFGLAARNRIILLALLASNARECPRDVGIDTRCVLE